MAIVGILIFQRQIAQFTVVRHYALVNALDMLRQIGNNLEPHPTLVTLVRKLPGVGQHVARQIILVLERFLANSALGRYALLVLDQLVLPDDGDRCEDFPTVLTLVFLFSLGLYFVVVGGAVVTHFMHFHTLPGAVPEGAEAALKWPHAGIMQTEVNVV